MNDDKPDTELRTNRVLAGSAWWMAYAVGVWTMGFWRASVVALITTVACLVAECRSIKRDRGL